MGEHIPTCLQTGGTHGVTQEQVGNAGVGRDVCERVQVYNCVGWDGEELDTVDMRADTGRQWRWASNSAQTRAGADSGDNKWAADTAWTDLCHHGDLPGTSGQMYCWAQRSTDRDVS